MASAPRTAVAGQAPPLTVGACASLACLWEATAPKPGNVYRGADFDDLTYADFIASAAVIGPIVDRARQQGVGATILAAVAATRAAVRTNTNLGMLLLMAPLAAVPAELGLRPGVGGVLRSLDNVDAEHAYAAIRLARPGGLGRVDGGDVNAETCPPMTLREAMSLAAERDMVARQYVDDFTEVFVLADRLATHACGSPLSDAIVRCYLEFLAANPDSLIIRKCGPKIAAQASRAAASVLDSAGRGPEAYAAALADFDFWLRSDGHRRNPGTTADIIAAALFVLLREQRLAWPVRFY
ncbi:MAG: triphosphoribosyl-dephospho-CoA synthetase [Planctomycetota bacterium]|nr:MAG: triphosphoribosyl-dephospho-CoA synthetase [Planctomycetota bacterium]